MTHRRALANPADFIVSGTVDNATTWYEDITLTQDGVPLADVDDHVWTLTIYREPGDDADLTLTTADGTLTITEAVDATTLGIRCAPSRLSDLCGDYMCDVRSTDASPTVDTASRVHLRARGTITFVEGAA
jgi:hypothetical protein